MHLPLEIDVSECVDNSKLFKTTTFELNFLMRTFSEAAVSSCDDCYSSQFVLEFSKFYFYQSFQDDSEDFTKIKNNLKLDQGKESEDIKAIRSCFTENKTIVTKTMFSSATSMASNQHGDTSLYEFGHKGNYFTLSLFMPFVFVFDEKENKIVHWPVAGPMNFNCRIIKHQFIKELNKKIMADDFNTSSEMSFAVPFKIDQSAASSGDASGDLGTLFSDVRPVKPEFENLRAVPLESDDFVPLFRLFFVSFF